MAVDGPPLECNRNRGKQWKGHWLRGKDRTTKIAFESGQDKLYFKIYAVDQTELLSLNQVANVNGSVVTIDVAGDGSTNDTEYSVLIHQSDLNLAVGGYRYEIIHYDNSANYSYTAVEGDLTVLTSAGGTIV